MKTLFKLIAIFFLILLYSCSDDDDNQEEVLPTDLLTVELNEIFLLNEKWFIEDITADSELDLDINGTSSTELLNDEIPQCDLDSFYVFNIQSDGVRNVTLDDGNDTCEFFESRYLFGLFPFNFPENRGDLVEINTLGVELLGGLPDVTDLDNAEFFISRDTTFKIFSSTIQVTDRSGNEASVTYVLRANADNRP